MFCFYVLCSCFLRSCSVIRIFMFCSCSAFMFYVHVLVVIPHITDAIQEWIERVANVPVDGLKGEPDVCIIEVSPRV